jgi:hypothetical protein
MNKCPNVKITEIWVLRKCRSILFILQLIWVWGSSIGARETEMQALGPRLELHPVLGPHHQSLNEKDHHRNHCLQVPQAHHPRGRQRTIQLAIECTIIILRCIREVPRTVLRQL